MSNHNIINEALDNLTYYPYAGEAVANPNDLDEAYREGAFFAETDWQWALKEPVHARPTNMSEHRAMAWAFVSGTVCPDWNNADAWNAFYIGYEDRATELADAGEAGYEAVAEAGSVAATEGWIVQSNTWGDAATAEDKAIRAILAIWAGARCWHALAKATGMRSDLAQAEQAQSRAETAWGFASSSQTTSLRKAISYSANASHRRKRSIRGHRIRALRRAIPAGH